MPNYDVPGRVNWHYVNLYANEILEEEAPLSDEEEEMAIMQLVFDRRKRKLDGSYVRERRRCIQINGVMYWVKMNN